MVEAAIEDFGRSGGEGLTKRYADRLSKIPRSSIEAAGAAIHASSYVVDSVINTVGARLPDVWREGIGEGVKSFLRGSASALRDVARGTDAEKGQVVQEQARKSAAFVDLNVALHMQIQKSKGNFNQPAMAALGDRDEQDAILDVIVKGLGILANDMSMADFILSSEVQLDTAGKIRTFYRACLMASSTDDQAEKLRIMRGAAGAVTDGESTLPRVVERGLGKVADAVSTGFGGTKDFVVEHLVTPVREKAMPVVVNELKEQLKKPVLPDAPKREPLSKGQATLLKVSAAIAGSSAIVATVIVLWEVM